MPTSSLVSNKKLADALQQYGEDYISLVFCKYKNPPSSIESSVKGGSPTFRSVTNFFSRNATLMWIRFHIAETFAFLGIFDTASKYQIQQTAELIIDHEVYGNLNLEEFLQFLRQFKRGDYGKLYQSARPNPQEFLACLKPFWHELVEYRIRLEQEKRQQQLDADLHNPENMSYEEWQEIKTIERMYEMKIPEPLNIFTDEP